MQRRLERVATTDSGYVLKRDPDSVVEPDVPFVASERLPSDRRGWLDLAPDLAVEVVSPNDRFDEVMTKVEKYLAGGVRLIWLVQPLHKRVLIYRPGQPHTE